MHILSMWTVYDHPADYPDVYVARRFDVTSDGEPRTREIVTSESLPKLRNHLRRCGYVRLERDDFDDPVIVESWL